MPNCVIDPEVTSTSLGVFTSLFEQQVLECGDEVAIEFEGTVWTYREVNRRANQIARFLVDHAFKPEDRIGICMDRSATAIISMLGIMKSGCAFVPLDPEFPKDRLAFIVEDASIQMIFCDRNYLHLFDATSDHSPEFIDPHDEQLWQLDCENLSLQVDEDSLAYVMYTSGSTGKPKGVQIEHRALTTYCLADVEIYQLCRSDRTLQFSTLNFDIAIEEIFPPLLVGSTVVVRPRERAETHNELSYLIETYQITALHIATAYWHEWVDLLVASNASVPGCLRLLIATGEKVSVEHFSALETSKPTSSPLVQRLWPPPRRPLHAPSSFHQTLGMKLKCRSESRSRVTPLTSLTTSTNPLDWAKPATCLSAVMR